MNTQSSSSSVPPQQQQHKILQTKTPCTIQQNENKQEYELASLMIVNKILVLCDCSSSNKIIVHIKLDENVFAVKRSRVMMENNDAYHVLVTLVHKDMLIDLNIHEIDEEKFDSICDVCSIHVMSSSTANNDNNNKEEVKEEENEVKEIKEEAVYNNVVASTIDTTAQFVSNNMIYGAGMIGDGMDWSGQFIRTNIVGDTYKTDIKVPGIIKGTVYAGERVTGFASWASGLVINAVVDSVSYVATNAVVPVVNATVTAAVPGVAGEAGPDSYITSAKEVASSTISGIGSIITAAQASKDILVTDFKQTTYVTVSHTLGKDSADIAKDAISTVNNCVNVASNTSGVKAIATKIATKTAVKSIKDTVSAVKKHQNEKKLTAENTMEEEQQQQQQQLVDSNDEYVVIDQLEDQN
jgi:hypothetical protein